MLPAFAAIVNPPDPAAGWSPLMVVKLRADYPELAVYQDMPGSRIEKKRHYITNRYNSGASSAPRVLRESVSKLFARTALTGTPENLTTGTQAQAALQTLATSAGTRVGTWTGSATVGGVTDIRYSTVKGDKVTYRLVLTGSERVFWRTSGNAGNGGVAALKVTDVASGLEIDPSYEVLPAVSGEYRLDLATQAPPGQTLQPVTEVLPAGTYDVQVKVSDANPVGGRVMDGGMLTFPALAFNAAGRQGTFQNRTIGADTTIPTSYMPGHSVVIPFTGTRFAWTHGKTSNAGRQDVRIYDAAGVEITTGYAIAGNEVESYSSTASVVSDLIASGMAPGQKYAVIRAKATKHASATGYRMYDRTGVSYDENVPGVLGVDAPDDQGITGAGAIEGTVTTQGTGNRETAVQVYRPGDDAVTKAFVGGGHGGESAPYNLVYKLNGVAIDFAGAAVGAFWIGQRFEVAFTCDQYQPADATKFREIDYRLIFQGDELLVGTRPTHTAAAMIVEDYVFMAMSPNRTPGNQGQSGGFELFGLAANDPEPYHFTSNHNDIIDLPAQVADAYFLNDDYVVRGEILNLAEIRAAHSDPIFAGTRALSFLQDRDDGFGKVYTRPFAGSNAGVLVPAGHSYQAWKRYRTMRRAA